MSRKRPKFRKGEKVLYKGDVQKIERCSYTTHPEHLIGGRRAKEGFYCQLVPTKGTLEEVSGWVNEKQIKKTK